MIIDFIITNLKTFEDDLSLYNFTLFQETSSEIVVVETSSIGSRTPKKTKEVPRGQEPTVSSSSTFSAVKSTSSSQSSSTSSESHNDINNRLDYLASNLDPWAHIQHAEHQVTTHPSPLVHHHTNLNICYGIPYI